MTWVIMIVVLTGGAVVQTLLPATIFLGEAKCPFLLAGVLYYALNRETNVMLAAAFWAGFLQDALSPIPLGYSSFCFCVVGWAASRFRNLVIIESSVTQVFFGGMSGIIVTIILYVLLVKEGLITHPAGHIMLKTAGTGILAMICTPIMFALTGRLDHLVGNVRIGVEVEEMKNVNGSS